MLVNDTLHGNMTKEKIDELVETLEVKTTITRSRKRLESRLDP